MKRGVAPGGQHLDRQGAGQVHFARADHAVLAGEGGQALAGHQAAVDLGLARQDTAVHGDAPARFHADDIADAEVCDRNGFLSLGADAQRTGHLERGQFLRRGPRRGARPVIEVSPAQQEEAQHHRRVEIGVVARQHRLVERGDHGQRDGQRDRHIHVQPTALQRSPCRDVEGAPGKDHRRDRDQCADPVHHVAGHAFGPRPDRDRQQHDVHHREERDGQPHQQVAALPVGGGRGQHAGVELMRLVARAFQDGAKILGRHLRPRLDRGAAQGQVHACVAHAGHRGQRPFHPPRCTPRNGCRAATASASHPRVALPVARPRGRQSRPDRPRGGNARRWRSRSGQSKWRKVMLWR